MEDEAPAGPGDDQVFKPFILNRDRGFDLVARAGDRRHAWGERRASMGGAPSRRGDPSWLHRRRRGLPAGFPAPVHNRTICFVSAACCLPASAAAALRARPAAAFAALNHMLISGFFFNQGFAMDLIPSIARGRFRMSRRTSQNIAVQHERPALPFVPREATRGASPRRLLPICHAARQSAFGHDRAARTPMLQCTIRVGA